MIKVRRAKRESLEIKVLLEIKVRLDRRVRLEIKEIKVRKV